MSASPPVSDAYDKLLAQAMALPVAKPQVRKRSQRQERKLAGEIGGQAVKGSGAFAGNKGDFRNETWAGEAKLTDDHSYRLTLAELEKIELEAAQLQRLPVFVVELTGRSFAVVSWELFKEFRDAPETPADLFKLGLL